MRWRVWLLALLAWVVAACTPRALMTPDPVLPEIRIELPEPVGLVEQALGDAADAMGLLCDHCDFRAFHSSHAEFAETWFIGSSVPLLIYDRNQLLVEAIEPHGYDSAVGVFAHELGHVEDFGSGMPVVGDSGELLNRADMELSADSWAGCALQILGGDTGPMKSLISAFCDGLLTVAQRHRAIDDGHGACRQRWAR